MDFSIGSGLGYNRTNNILYDSGKAENIKAALNKSDASDEELMEACKSFEAYLLEQVFKGMEKTVLKDEDEEENDYLMHFSDKLYEEYAKEATKGQGIGLAQMLFEAMKRNS
ncbi:MAG: hypothetical protein GX757_12190 [Clostridiales bacterium]|nr:hypothetical protein [Clostridiales bacterium]